MREIKFRAWHKQEKKMNHIQYLHFNLQGDAYGVLVRGQLLSVDDFEIMQYTGLKDKNGKEIYEGDILGTDDPEDTSKAVVVFHEGAFKPQLIVKREKPLFDTYWDDWRVIGNIHEQQ